MVRFSFSNTLELADSDSSSQIYLANFIAYFLFIQKGSSPNILTKSPHLTTPNSSTFLIKDSTVNS